MLTTQNVSTPKSKQQILNERRAIRKEYRKLITHTQASRSDLVNPESKGLLEVLEKGEDLYRKVDHAREAALDSEFLSLTSQYGLEQVQSLKITLTNFNSLVFMNRVKDRLNESEDDLTDAWTKLGASVKNIYNPTPLFDFMYGPMELEIKEKKKPERRQKTQEEELGKKVTAEKVDDTQNAESESTSTGVQAMRSFLERKQQKSFLDTVVDQKSFARTVENIFYYSFLLKDGHVAMKSDNQDGITAQISHPPEEKDFKDGSAIPKHSIVKMDYELWRKLTQLTEQEFDINQEAEYMKKRQSTQSGNQKDDNPRPQKKAK
ncbi:hypothetical protein DLAC_03715 [Tieghemostelium lacteum]|uniref:Non-structural maintenance of chromosomes element 4 n=1 Tax=Tieghemostelium lacteum TaxID=361077 RepID=A0A152A123_TIELA|nr:hypothetical protein DLAC_03715 [Tieghemostelium lacteum]|eukprot:KYQ99770.1 hypothetical protein DLAC_03715 [Tieghemostelium lacteum]